MEVFVSHKWVNQVLAQRGIRAPVLAVIEASIKNCDAHKKATLFALLKKIEQGVEGEGDIDAVRSLITHSEVPAEEVHASPVKKAVVNARRVAKTGVVDKAGVKTSVDGELRATYTLDKRKRPKHHIYGAKAALTIELDYLRLVDEQGSPYQTVTLDAARATGAREYDWAHKVAFQFMRRELPLLACALLGLLADSLELANHGQGANKTVLIEDQGRNLFVRVREGQTAIAVPVLAADVHAWLELVLQALRFNAPDLGDAMHIAMLKRVADMQNKKVSNAKNST